MEYGLEDKVPAAELNGLKSFHATPMAEAQSCPLTSMCAMACPSNPNIHSIERAHRPMPGANHKPQLAFPVLLTQGLQTRVLQTACLDSIHLLDWLTNSKETLVFSSWIQDITKDKEKETC